MNVGNTRDTRCRSRLLPCPDVHMTLSQRLAGQPLTLDRLVELTLIIPEPGIDQMVVAYLSLHVEAKRALGIGPHHAIDAVHEVIGHMMCRTGGKGTLAGELIGL